MTEIWRQQGGEGDKAFNAFRCYLKLGSVEKVAKELNLSAKYVQNQMARHEWRARRRAYLDSLLEQARQEMKAELTQMLKTQWRDCAELQAAAIAALRKKDLAAAGFRSLNEIYHSAAQLQLKIIEQLDLFGGGDEDDSKQLKINIVPLDHK